MNSRSARSEGGRRQRGDYKESHPTKPLISVVTVVFNGEQFLENTIQNVLGQTYDNVEYIIIDGGSNDNTIDIIKRNDDAIDYWISEPDSGIYDAMNKGVALARGELIGIVNADDWYEKTTIELIVKSYLLHEEADIFHGNISKNNFDGAFIKISKPVLDFDKIYSDMIFWHPTFFVKKSLYDKLGVYSVKFKVAGDYDFLMRCYQKNIKFHYLDRVLTHFRIGGASSSSAYLGFWECKEIALNAGFPKHKVLLMYYKRCVKYTLARIINPIRHLRIKKTDTK